MTNGSDRAADFPGQMRLLRWVFWPALVFGFALLTATADMVREAGAGREVRYAAILWREFASGLVLLGLAWLLMRVDRRWPLRVIGAWRFALLHLALTVPFALIHLFGATFLYVLPDLTGGARLNPVYILGHFPVAYAKDVIVYAIFLGLITLQRYLMDLLRGDTRRAIEREALEVDGPDGSVFLDLRDIVRIEGARNYVSVFTAEREYLKRITLRDLEELLPGDRFLRVHRSHIVNRIRIVGMKTRGRRDPVLEMDDASQVSVGRSYRESVRGLTKD